MRNTSIVLGDGKNLLMGNRNRLFISQNKRAWTKRDRAQFLETLERTCNVTTACRAIKRNPSTAYSLRLRDPQFASDWAAAIDRGYAHLEARLLEIAMAQISDFVCDADSDDAAKLPVTATAASEKFDTALALRLVASHHKKMVQAPTHAPLRIASDAETDALIVKQLKILHQRMLKQQQQCGT